MIVCNIIWYINWTRLLTECHLNLGSAHFLTAKLRIQIPSEILCLGIV